jgi:hypothetical protein
MRRAALIIATILSISSVFAADRSVNPIVSRIHREPVGSSALVTVGYSRSLHALEIEFRDGRVYRYLEVPLRQYRELLSADSKARYYNHYIRGKFHCLRVRPKHAR